MSRFLYTWELGANLGHVGPFLPIARRLMYQNHEIVLALRDTRAAAQLIPAADIPWIQAPYLQEVGFKTPPLSYPDILRRYGFNDPVTLTGHVKAWLEIFNRFGTQVVIADHSPTAMLAARIAGIPAMLFGSGFFCPPRSTPMPPLRPWLSLPAGTLDNIDNIVLGTINAVLSKFDRPAIQHVADLLDMAETSLLGFPELDHYGFRPKGSYWGNLGSEGTGIHPQWPAASEKKIFAYLRPTMRHFQATVSALTDSGQSVVIYCPGIPPKLAKELEACPSTFLAQAPMDLAIAAPQADVAITYAAMSTTNSFLLAGKPVLLVPGHIEQFLLAQRVQQAGMGLLIHPEKQAVSLSTKLNRLLFEPDFTMRARAFSEKYHQFTSAHVADNITKRLTELAPT